ncbi:MAG: C39 family peptidase, partial [Anaerolineae bacterium]|nr:C39 family peptidase [Anaerolineae bacterium]
EDVSPMLKHFDKDKNVMPYEMADYVNEHTNLKAVVRQGGTVNLLKTLVANGFPVMVEKGVMFRDTTGRVSWMGHYNIVLGYDEAQQQFITHDSYLEDGKFKSFPYEQLKQEWQAFNYVFLVVYPADQWDKLAGVLGPYADEAQSYNIALDISSSEMSASEGSAHFFALFNRGSNLVKLQDYGGAAAAYDEAYNYYATLPEQNRPYRMAWYQTGPYFAYYYMGRYQDVIQLATTTLETTPEPYLEESFYWRALAEVMVGQRDEAINDLCTSIKYHPDFSPSVSELSTLGVSACP